ncbi:hypothetical protein QBC38DRAFT_475754 [Podospora fimiseda]|uniref:LCCL domain-containing protein n=1 Tax=Podospora fimiseda TaxID=252190 RepID=A0AAN7BRJ7_9PEZI|nr:hypothetical protein QBC38DRAFT_475754 [Podospora fimiseda]
MGENQVNSTTQTIDVENSDASATVHADHPDAPIRDAPRIADLEEDNSPPTPRFIQDEGSWKRFKWVPYPVRRWIKVSVKWSQGSPVPRRYRIQPILPAVQQYPAVFIERRVPKKLHRALIVLGYYIVWIATFAMVMRNGQNSSEVPGWGNLVKIGCGSTYWLSGNGCGLNGIDCRPFDDGGFAFRCPANCVAYHVLNPHAVGDQEVVYKPLVVGGAPASGDDQTAIYRGDSFICGSAIHAGLISNTNGGCGVVRLIGRQVNFNGTSRNGISSVGFDSYFPLSYTFEERIECEARDPRWSLLSISVVFSTVFSLFVSSPALFFFTVFSGMYWTVGLATDTPNYTTIAGLFQTEIGRYLPAMFVAWVMYDKMGIRHTLKGMTAHIEKTVLWLGGAWVGALTNYTFDFIPIQRLTAHDLNQQPGAQAALAIIIIVLVVIAAFQIWLFRQEGRLISHLKLYAMFILGLVICLTLPSLNLRIHHYILALLLLPGTSLQTRPSLLYQGILIGLFVNGIARWGFDPILQTAYSLRGDAPTMSPLPDILNPEISLADEGNGTSSITFSWAAPPAMDGTAVSLYDGISVLVNDVERFREYFDDGLKEKTNITWFRDPSVKLNEYFRFAWMQGSSTWDYTKAGKWDSEGKWTEMKPGPSLKVREWDMEMDMGELRKRQR